jgi:hypothetical protein
MNFYAGGGLDRLAHLRTEEGWIERVLGGTRAQIVAVWQTRNLVIGGDQPQAALLTVEAARSWLDEARVLAVLGESGERMHLAIDVSHWSEEEAQRRAVGLGEWTDLRRVGPLLGREEGALLA